ncbi:MAG: cell division FtsA domain-containing protein [Bacilli bacterium]|nr:cell division FtsA domain-containing protein [Bacilli bacterium]
MKQIYTGIDIGNDTIKIVVSEVVNGKFHILASSSTKTKGLKKEMIVNEEELTSSIIEAKKEIEDKLGIKIDQAIITIPSDDREITIVEGKTFIESDDNIVGGEEVINVLKDAVLGSVKEGREMVSIIPISFHVDNDEGIKNPTGAKGEELKVKAVLTTVPKNNINRIIPIIKKAEIEVVDICLGAVGDYYQVRSKNLDKQIGAIVNIGYGNTEVSVFNKGIMIKNEKIDMGSKYVDKDISFMYKIDRGKAKSLKENFAVSNKRYADVNDIIEVANKYGESITINQLEISEIVEARLIEILKLVKKQISILTKREISYIIITGGISELAGFQYVVENVFGRIANTLNITEMGIRNNKYSSAAGINKYFHYKLELRSKNYSMINDKKTDELVSPKKKLVNLSSDTVINKFFEYFTGN